MNKLIYSLSSIPKAVLRISEDTPIYKNTSFWRALIIGIILLVSAYLCPKAAFGERNATYVLLGIAGIFAVIFTLKFSQVVFISIVAATLVVPFEIGTGSESSLNMGILMVGLMAFTMILEVVTSQYKGKIVLPPAILPVLILMFVSILSFGSGQLTYFATSAAPIRAQIGGLALFILSGFALLEVTFYIRELRWLRWMTWLFLIVGSIYFVGYYLPILSKILVDGANGSQFWTWTLTLAFSQALINSDLSKLKRYLLGILILVILFISMFETRDWISGWLPGLLSLGLILWIYKKEFRIPLLFVPILTFVLNSNIFSDLFGGGDNQYSLLTRLEAWRILGEIIKANPILGLGPANYYWYTSLFPILGYTVNFNSHNNYVDIVAQTGILGLLSFLWIGWELGRVALRLIKTAPAGFARAYAYGAFGGLIATYASGMLGDWIIPFVYNIGFSGFRSTVLGWIFLGGLLALDRILQNDLTKRSLQDNTRVNVLKSSKF